MPGMTNVVRRCCGFILGVLMTSALGCDGPGGPAGAIWGPDTCTGTSYYAHCSSKHDWTGGVWDGQLHCNDRNAALNEANEHKKKFPNHDVGVMP